MISQSSHRHPALSDVYGKIEQVLLTIPSKYGMDAVRKKYLGILEALGGRVKYIILAPLRGDAPKSEQIQQYWLALKHKDWLPQEQAFILEQDFELDQRNSPPTPWVQDPFSMLRGEDGWPIFLEPYYFGKNTRGQDQHIAEQVSAHTGYLMKSTRYFFEGGNILVGDDFMLVGRDTLVKNLQQYHYDVGPLDHGYEAAVRHISCEFCHIFGVDAIIWLGTEEPFPNETVGVHQGEFFRQVFFHIDLYVSLGGKTAGGEELVFVAELREEDLVHAGVRNDAGWLSIKAALDSTAQQLAEAHQRQFGPKFQVVRVPMGLTRFGSGNIAPLSFNNCLTEVYQGIKTAYLPHYQAKEESDAENYFARLADAAAEAYRDEGFSIVWVHGDFLSSAPSFGSLHCIVKVIRRRHYPY